RGAREEVDTAVVTAAVGIDRLVEADVGRIVAADDAARALLGHYRIQARLSGLVGQRGQPVPAVVLQPRRALGEAAVHERGRAAAADGLGGGGMGPGADTHAASLARPRRGSGDGA